MSDGIRAEMHLRLLAEQNLLDGGGHHPFGGPVLSAAEALVAVGAVEQQLAEAIVRDFDLACYLRSRGGRPFFRSNAGAVAPPVDLPSRRVSACRSQIEVSGWRVQVRYAVLGDDMTMLGVHATQLSPTVAGPPGLQVPLADDRGRTTTADFSGGGGPAGFEGVLTARVPLARDTAWIRMGSHRIELVAGDPPRPPVRIEELPPADPALAYLWGRLATSRRHTGPDGADLEAAIGALVHVGMLDPDSPDIPHLHDVSQTLLHPARMMGRGLAWSRPSSSTLPEPWASLAATLRRPPPQGPAGLVAVGSVTPPIDGAVIVMVEAVISHPDHFEIRVATSPGVSVHPGMSLGEPSLAWWARSDRGGVYLGTTGNWGGGPQHSQGTLMFWPALDPGCRQLELMPTGRRERAVIPIPLAWIPEA